MKLNELRVTDIAHEFAFEIASIIQDQERVIASNKDLLTSAQDIKDEIKKSAADSKSLLAATVKLTQDGVMQRLESRSLLASAFEAAIAAVSLSKL